MTIDEAKEVIGFAHDAAMYGWGFMRSLGPEKVAAACNGCGPESWPQEWRDKLGKWLKTFRPAFDGHDCRFTYDNDGTREKFDYANDELEKNCLLLADRKYAWYNPLRYFARNRAKLIGGACRTFGWQAWQDAFRKTELANQENNNQKKEKRP